MSAAAEHRWDQRRFVSLAAFFSGLALPVTGVADHLARHSSGPHAGPGWIVAHVTVSAVFVGFVSWHGWLNRRALTSYLRGSAARAVPSRDEGVPRSHRRRRTPSLYVSLDRSLCRACFECVAVCPQGALGKIDALLHKHAVMRAGDSCTGCGRCVNVCAAGALTFVHPAQRP